LLRINVVFVDKDGKEQAVQAPLGKNMLEVAHDNEVELEGEIMLGWAGANVLLHWEALL
jgi:hypothetical protein